MSEIAKQETGVIKSAAENKLDKLIKNRTAAQRVVLAIDRSGSMASSADTPGERRIDALRGVVNNLRSRGMGFRMLAFDDTFIWTDVVPEPAGGTDMGGALEFCGRINPEHVIIVSDGQPNSQEHALCAAKALRCKVDVFYVGPSSDTQAKEFLESLANATGGMFGSSSFAELENKIAGVLGAGTPDTQAETKPFVMGS